MIKVSVIKNGAMLGRYEERLSASFFISEEDVKMYRQDLERLATWLEQMFCDMDAKEHMIQGEKEER